MSDKTNRLSICLIKPNYKRFDHIVKPDLQSHEIGGIGTFYLADSHPRPPEWVQDFFGATLSARLRLITSSAKGVLLVRIKQEKESYIFAVVFGFGRYLLQEDVVEESFGLKVVLNTVDPVSLRSIDKTTLGSVPKQTREQIGRAGEASNFGIDIEQDLLKAVTGSSTDLRLGKMISGRDALAVSVKVDVTEITEFLKLCIERFQSEHYKTNFAWIDQIKEVRSKRKAESLDAKLIERIKAGDLDKIWMAVPEIVDWPDVKGFRYLRAKTADMQEDLDLRKFLETRGNVQLDIDRLKQEAVFMISAKTDDVADRWTAYKCIYAELEESTSAFILNNGKWYEVIADFARRIKAEFDALQESPINFPEYGHGNEGEYNEALPAAIRDSCCMDRQMVVHGGGRSQIEFCDLLTRDKKLIHIKRYGGSSSLSHLFAQGVVSGELFVSDREFRRKLNEKLPDGYKLNDVNARPNPSDYEVVFGIISKSGKPLDIPFFSKVSLGNARRRLEGFGYKVSKKKISVSAGGN